MLIERNKNGQTKIIPLGLGDSLGVVDIMEWLEDWLKWRASQNWANSVMDKREVMLSAGKMGCCTFKSTLRRKIW